MTDHLRGLTAAGPLRIRTGFPYKALAGHPRYSQIRPQARCGGDIHGRRPIYLHQKDLYSIWTEKIIHTMLFQHRQAFLTVNPPSRLPAWMCVNATNARNTLNFCTSMRNNCIHAHFSCTCRHVLLFCSVHYTWNNPSSKPSLIYQTPRPMRPMLLIRLPASPRMAGHWHCLRAAHKSVMRKWSRGSSQPRADPEVINPLPNRLAFFLATAILY